MFAEYFSSTPKREQVSSTSGQRSIEPRLRQVHRWISVIFTLTVAANFIAMIWGQPPAVITYSPLPPLLFLTITGLYMLSRHVGRSRRARRSFQTQR